MDSSASFAIGATIAICVILIIWNRRPHKVVSHEPTSTVLNVITPDLRDNDGSYEPDMYLDEMASRERCGAVTVPAYQTSSHSHYSDCGTAITDFETSHDRYRSYNTFGDSSAMPAEGPATSSVAEIYANQVGAQTRVCKSVRTKMNSSRVPRTSGSVNERTIGGINERLSILNKPDNWMTSRRVAISLYGESMGLDIGVDPSTEDCVFVSQGYEMKEPCYNAAFSS